MPEPRAGRASPRPPDLDRLQQHFVSGLAAAMAGGGAAAVVSPRGEHLIVHGHATTAEPVTPATLFHVCSCSKTFTAAVMSLLVQEGTADWETRVADLVPEFRTRDEAVNRGMTLRDLAAMRIGLSRAGIAEWGMRQDLPKASRLARARHMALAAGFRERFSYSNLCYIALALAAERVSGRPFPQLLRELTAPLGMHETVSAGFGVEPRASAAPHLPVDGRPSAVRDLTGPNSEGSARIHLSGGDALRWLRFLLAGLAGSDAGPLRSARLAEMAEPAASIPEPEGRLAPEGGRCAYGMGFYLATFLGQRLLRHGGGGRGWRHAMALLPDSGTGVFLMASAESPRVEGLALELLEIAHGRSPRDWQGKSADEAAAAARREQEAIDTRFPLHGPETPLAITAGVYAHPVTGRVHVEAGKDTARIVFEDAPDFDAVLEPCGGAVYRFRFAEPALAEQPLDPPFRLRVEGTGREQVLRTTWFDDLERAE